MEFIRRTVNSKVLESLLDLPDSMKNRRVEVIVFPVDEGKKSGNHNETLGGRLNKYANPSLRQLEKSAWSIAVEDKHENR